MFIQSNFISLHYSQRLEVYGLMNCSTFKFIFGNEHGIFALSIYDHELYFSESSALADAYTIEMLLEFNNLKMNDELLELENKKGSQFHYLGGKAIDKLIDFTIYNIKAEGIRPACEKMAAICKFHLLP